MRTVDIVYLYEHAARELDIACAVTAGLRQRGVHVEIMHWPTGFPRAVNRIRPRVVILPFCYTEQSYEALLAYWRESVFFNLTWEQLFYLGNRIAKTPRGKFALKHVIHHAWSEAYLTFLLASGVAEQFIFINGQPAYALYNEPYRRYFASRAELASRYSLDPTRRWIFFPENYNWAFYSQATLEHFVANGQSYEDLHVMREFCDSSLATVLKWCVQAAQEENIELLLRPRPSTLPEDFMAYVRQVLSGLPAHLHILNKETVREWVLASDLVISSHSTSLIEAAVAGKPACILEPFPMPPLLHTEWHDLIPHIKTSSDFLRACSGSGLGDSHAMEQWARATFLSRGDAIEGLVKYLNALVNDQVEKPAFPAREAATPSLCWIPPAWLWALYRRTKQYLRFPITHGIEPEFVKDVLPHSELETKISKWAVVMESEL